MRNLPIRITGLLAGLFCVPAAAAPKGVPAERYVRRPPETRRALAEAKVTELAGTAFRVSGTARTSLKPGDPLGADVEVRTGAGADLRLEISFKDGSLLRLQGDTVVRLAGGERRVELRAGRLLVQADRMVGGVAVWTPLCAFVPEGTTYIVSVDPKGAADLFVLEGAVRVVRPRPAPLHDQQAMVLPGETLHADASAPLGHPVPRDLLKALVEEALVRAYARPLATQARIRDLGDQQRRGVLPGRNERLRREIFWQRPKMRPLDLPDLFRPD